MAQLLKTWLFKHALWEGVQYASWRLPPDLVVQGVTGDWCNDFGVLDVIGRHCDDPDCVCVCPPVDRWNNV